MKIEMIYQGSGNPALQITTESPMEDLAVEKWRDIFLTNTDDGLLFQQNKVEKSEEQYDETVVFHTESPFVLPLNVYGASKERYKAAFTESLYIAECLIIGETAEELRVTIVWQTPMSYSEGKQIINNIIGRTQNSEAA